MSDELDKLKNAMNAAAGSPDDTARNRAISAGMEEFEKNFQGSADTARLTPEQPQWRALLSRGAKDMFRRLTTREALLTTASLATIAIAVVVTYDANKLPTDNHGPIVISEDGVVSGIELAAIDKVAVEIDERTDLTIADAEPAAVAPLDDSVVAELTAEAIGEELVDADDSATAKIAAEYYYSDRDGMEASLVPNETMEQSLSGHLYAAPAAPMMMEEAEAQIDGFDATPAATGESRQIKPSAVIELHDGPTSSLNFEAAPIPAAPAPAYAPVPGGYSGQKDQIVFGGGIAEPQDDMAPIQPPLAEQFPVTLEPNTEQFPETSVSPLKITNDEPVSTFSIDVDTAAYGIVRSSLMDGYLPPVDAIRTEEIINYFSYDYPLPQEGEAPFSTSVTVLDTPWNDDTKLLHIGIQGYDIAVDDRPPVNLVFLIDTSGSMNDADKLPLLINSFRLMLANLQPDDQVAIVTYAGSAGMALAPTPASDSARILRSLKNLSAGGSTAGQAGLQQAYALAEQMAAGNEATGRVILATDGDFNVGISDPAKLQEFVEDKRETGVYLSVLGFGRGNYNDTIMQTLAQNGNGTASYIDTLAEAQKVLVDQIGGALFTIAQDVKIQIEFNPAEIAEYRLIGYETRALNREDFNNDAVDAGEIGSGHSVTAIYEITPVGSAAISVDDLRYATEPADVAPETNGEYAFLKLRYKNPGEDVSNLITTPVFPDANANLGVEVQFAVAAAGFSQILRNDDRIRGWDIDDAIALAQSSRGEDPFGYRAEFITLMRLADSLK